MVIEPQIMYFDVHPRARNARLLLVYFRRSPFPPQSQFAYSHHRRPDHSVTPLRPWCMDLFVVAGTA